MKDPHSERERPEPADSNWRHPVEEMEPLELAGYREASMKALFLLNKILIFALDADNKTLALWEVAYALGLPACEGVSMTERSSHLGLKRATLSKGAKEFCRANSLPPSEYMKDADSTASFAAAREKQLQ